MFASNSLPPCESRSLRATRSWLRIVWFTACSLVALSGAPIAAAAPAASPLPVIDGKWQHYTSPHFELYSRQPDDASRKLLRNLELLRTVFLDHLKLKERLHVPVTIFAFRKREEFLAYAPDSMKKSDLLAGFHLFLPDRAVICMAPADDNDEAQRTIFHEYIHHLFKISENEPPLWVNEGTAELFAGLSAEGKKVRIGTPVVNRLLYLRQEPLLPLDQLFATDHQSRNYTDDKHTGVFYAESWALLHYWYYGDTKLPPGSVERFMAVASHRETAAKTDLRSLFQSCFGCDYREMLRQLDTYIARGSYRIGVLPMPKIEAPGSYTARAVPVDEITVRLAELAVRVQHSPMGRLMLLNAMTERPDDPRPLETLGMEAYLDQDASGTADYWEKALAAGSKNPAVLRELALLEGRQWFSSYEDTFRLPNATAERMRGRLLRSIEAEPEQGAAFETLAWVESFATKPEAKNVNLIIGQLPKIVDKRRTIVALAHLMFRVGKPDQAATLIDFLDRAHLEPAEAQALSSLHTRLAAELPDAQSSPEANGRVLTPPPATPGVKTPSVGLPNDL